MKLLLVFLLCLSLNAYSQKKTLSVKISALSLVDEISFPTIQPGIEFHLSKKLTWYNEVGIKYRQGYYEKEGSDTTFIKPGGFKIKTEVRYYFRTVEEKKFTGPYVAVNVFFIKDRHNTEIEYYYQRDSSQVKPDAFGVEKKVFGFNFIYGFQIPVSAAIAIDLYCGVGLRFRDVVTINKEFDKYRDGFIGAVDPNIQSGKQGVEARGGNTVTSNLSMGVRVCFNL